MRWRFLVAACALGCGGGRPPATYALDGGNLAVSGAAFVAARGCPSCHQQAGHAGTLAGQLVPVAGTQAFGADLTPDPTTGLGDWADIEIVRAIRFGVDNAGNPLCPAMPQYPQMGDVEADAIVAYLRSLPPVARAIPPSLCPPIKPIATPDLAMPGE
jgi:hypothetical protein